MNPRAKLRVLVTGATGFLGRHVARALYRDGYEAIPTGRLSTDKKRRLDITCEKGVRSSLKALAPDIIVNCAVYGVDFRDQDLKKAMAVNLLGAMTLLEAAAECGVSRFLHVGSCFEYGSSEDSVNEKARLDPFGIYGSTKAAASLMLIERSRSLGIPLLVVRPFGMWGPGEGKHRLVPQIIQACCRREPLNLTPCDVVRDYSYVEDVAQNLVALLSVEEWTSNPVVNLGSGEGVLLRDFVLRIATALDGGSLMHFGRRPHRRGELESLVGDVRLFRQLVGKTPVTTIEAGLRRMKIIK